MNLEEIAAYQHRVEKFRSWKDIASFIVKKYIPYSCRTEKVYRPIRGRKQKMSKE